MKLNLKSPICFFDIEATGSSITQDRIVEIAVIKLFPDGSTQCKKDRINPTIPISKEASALHGIYDKDVVHKPTFKEVAKEYAHFFKGADFSGFNIIRFDIPLLVEEFLRAEVNFNYLRKKIIDTKQIYHMMEKRNLQAAYAFYCNKELKNMHSAETDARASMEVLLAQIEKYEDQAVTDMMGNTLGVIKNDIETLHQSSTSNMIDLAGRMVRNKKGEIIMNFGKYKNQPVAKVLRENGAYYSWIMNGDFSLDTKRKLTEIKMNGFNKKE